MRTGRWPDKVRTVWPSREWPATVRFQRRRFIGQLSTLKCGPRAKACPHRTGSTRRERHRRRIEGGRGRATDRRPGSIRHPTRRGRGTPRDRPARRPLQFVRTAVPAGQGPERAGLTGLLREKTALLLSRRAVPTRRRSKKRSILRLAGTGRTDPVKTEIRSLGGWNARGGPAAIQENQSFDWQIESRFCRVSAKQRSGESTAR